MSERVKHHSELNHFIDPEINYTEIIRFTDEVALGFAGEGLSARSCGKAMHLDFDAGLLLYEVGSREILTEVLSPQQKEHLEQISEWAQSAYQMVFGDCTSVRASWPKQWQTHIERLKTINIAQEPLKN